MYNFAVALEFHHLRISSALVPIISVRETKDYRAPVTSGQTCVKVAAENSVISAAKTQTSGRSYKRERSSSGDERDQPIIRKHRSDSPKGEISSVISNSREADSSNQVDSKGDPWLQLRPLLNGKPRKFMDLVS